MITALETEIDALEAVHPMPAEFVVPGESMTGAALDLARSIAASGGAPGGGAGRNGGLPDSQVVPYLNRLADLLFVMARVADGGFRPLEAASRIALPTRLQRLHRGRPALAWRTDKETPR